MYEITVIPMIHFFRHPVSDTALPRQFNNPFHYTPHILCIEAAKEVQNYLSLMDLWKRKPEEGKMFGVLVVRTPDGKTGFLAAFSGILDGNYLHPYFVPPVYNLQQPDSFFRQEEKQISAINRQIRLLENNPAYLQAQQDLIEKKIQANHSLSIAKLQLKAAKAARDLQRNQNPDCHNASDLNRESQHRKAEYKRLEKYWKEQIAIIQNCINEFINRMDALKTERKQRSAKLQQQLFEQFQFLNARGETKNLFTVFREQGHNNPPAGAGECAAPKLLQFAYTHKLHPIAIAEFWWGCSPKTEIRRQGNYYPACQGKCGPILNFMLQGLNTETSAVEEKQKITTFPEIIYEDKWLLILNKPEGTLSIPGKTTRLSIYDMVRQHFPEATGPLLVHRLDMATSGLLIIAKDKNTHEHLQKQFLRQTIRKRYTALLEGHVTQSEGYITLPLCPDIYDRPRQMVNEKSGKPAITRFRVLGQTSQYTRIAFYPQTGRTHQLRVHAAHPLGLNCPIVGDTLYGTKAERLYLHAEYIEFIHPATGQKIQLEKPADF